MLTCILIKGGTNIICVNSGKLKLFRVVYLGGEVTKVTRVVYLRVEVTEVNKSCVPWG